MLKPPKYRDALGSDKRPRVMRRADKTKILSRNPEYDDSVRYTGKDANLSMQIGKIREQQNKGLQELKKGGKVKKKSKSRVNEAGNYTKPGMRKRLFNRIKAGGKGGRPGQWSARKAQMLASAYKKAGGGYKN
jgi:hypothetical protein